MSGRVVLEAHELRGGYGPGDAIEGVSFSVEAGQLVAVLGPNGGGKTTLFRAILDELPRVDGRVAASGRVAYVPQTERSRLDFPVSALDVVLMGTYASMPWYRRIDRRHRRLAADALERVGLAERAREQYGSLSGGQRQRVLIARALCREADVLLMDEPLSGVDRPSAARIVSLLASLRGEGRSVLLATHDIDQARSFDRVLCLNGRQVAFGDAAGTLTAEVLAETYGAELVLLEGGAQALVVQHHQHGHGPS